MLMALAQQERRLTRTKVAAGAKAETAATVAATTMAVNFILLVELVVV